MNHAADDDLRSRVVEPALLKLYARRTLSGDALRCATNGITTLTISPADEAIYERFANDEIVQDLAMALYTSGWSGDGPLKELSRAVRTATELEAETSGHQ